MAQDDTKSAGPTVTVAPEINAARAIALEQWARAMIGTGMMMGFHPHEIRLMLDPFNVGMLVAQMSIQAAQGTPPGGAAGPMPPTNE